MLRKSLLILSFIFPCLLTFAQEEVVNVPIKVEHEVAQPELSSAIEGNLELQDSLHLPVLNSLGQMPSLGYHGHYLSPLWGSWWGAWNLHEGLNVTLGASVFAQFGKNARRGAGFSQQIALQYAEPLTDKLSLAVGGYLTNVNWQHESFRDVGLSAVLGYQFNEKWEAYVYGQKSLVQSSNFIPRSFYEMEQLGDKIGAAVKYNFSPSFSMQLGVEQHIYPNHHVPMIPIVRNPEKF